MPAADGTAASLAADRTLHAAVVSSIREVLFVAVASSRERVRAQVAGYVEAHASTTLWPTDAGRVLELLSQERTEEAIQLYFERVGERWDREILYVDTVVDRAPRSDPRQT